MKRVVVIGGGFAGMHCVRKLQDHFAVTLVDEKDYFEFTPSILRVLVEPGHLPKIRIPHRRYLGKAAVVKGTATRITGHAVVVGKQRILFDYLVVATGSSYISRLGGMQMSAATNGEAMRAAHGALQRAGSVAVIGGGLVGVELMGELVECCGGKGLTLVEGERRLMSRGNAVASMRVLRFFRKRGVRVIFGELVREKQGGEFVTDKGTRIAADVAFLCVGVRPNSSLLAASFPDAVDERGFARVNGFLQLAGHTNIFVAGDVTGIAEEKTAQNAECHARVVVKNIRAREAGSHLLPYRSSSRIMVISLGKRNGIITYGSFALAGIFPAMLKQLIEWKERWKCR